MKKNIFFLRLIIALTLLFSSIKANSYDSSTLNIFAKIAPRFIMMSSQKKKLQEYKTSEITICLLHERSDISSVDAFIEKINKNYPKGIANNSLELLPITSSELTQCKNAFMLFISDVQNRDINSAIEFSRKNEILSMSYNPKFLENGVSTSIFIGRKVVPYINVEALQN